MSEVINFFKDEDKKAAFKEKVNSKIHEGIDWVNDNMELIVTLTPIVVGGTATILKIVNKRINLRKEESLKNLYCYDRSLGHYWRLRRELSNKEWLEIDSRKRRGERLSDILEELRVLK